MSKFDFAVTYERYFPHADDEDVCEADESGYVVDSIQLREAIELCGGLHACYHANEYPVRAPQWFTVDNVNDGTRKYYEQGISESRSLHIPDSVTPASRRRIARLLGAR
jgi:hypothetical protein